MLTKFSNHIDNHLHSDVECYLHHYVDNAMVKAKTKALNILLPEDLSEWFSDYAKTQDKTKTEIICSLLQGIQNGDAYSDVDKPVDNSVDGIESIVKAYLDKHLQSYIDNYLHGAKQADVVNPVDSDKDVYVDTDVVNPVDSNVDTDVDNPVDNPVDDSDVLPIIDAIATIAAPTVENPLPDETLSDAIAATKKQITYNLNHDGSVVLRSLRGIADKQLKRMSDDELSAIGLFKTLRGKDEKFFPTDETLALRYQEKSKPSAAQEKSKPSAATDKPQANKRSPKSSKKIDTGKPYTLVQMNRAKGLEKMKELGLEEIPETGKDFAILYPDHFEYDDKNNKLSYKKPKTHT